MRSALGIQTTNSQGKDPTIHVHCIVIFSSLQQKIPCINLIQYIFIYVLISAKERPTIASPESKSSSSTLSSNARIKLFELIGETLGDFVQFLRQLSIATKKLLLLDCNTAEEGVLAAEMIKQAYLGLMNLKTRHLLLLHDAFCLEEAEKSQCGDLESPFIPNANDHIIWKEAYNRLCAFSPEVVHLMDDSGIMDDGGDEG